MSTVPYCVKPGVNCVSIVLLSIVLTVLCRHDLELQLSCYNASEEKDKQTSTCNWPPEVTIGINDHTLPVDKVRNPDS